MKKVTKEMIYKKICKIQEMYNKNGIEACIIIQYKPCNIIIARKGVDNPVIPIIFKTYTECYGWLTGYIMYFKEWNEEVLNK